MKYLMWFATVSLGLMGLVRAGMADDYTYLFDPSTMQMGQTVGEYLEVKEMCPDPNDKTTCLKYVTSITGRNGRLEIPVNAGNDFEISFNIFANGWISISNNLTITLYLSDESSLPLGISGGTLFYSDNKTINLSWVIGVNDFRLISEQGILKISSNDVSLKDVKLTLSGTITRIVISKITDGEEGLFEIRTRGIQKGGSASCPTTSTTTTTTPTPAGDCTASYVPDSGRLIVPCVAVPVTIPFAGTQMLNYSVEMQQRPSEFVFDLDLNTVKQQ